MGGIIVALTLESTSRSTAAVGMEVLGRHRGRGREQKAVGGVDVGMLPVSEPWRWEGEWR